MKIGDFSKHFHTPVSTIRFYAENDLLTPLRRNNQYVFTENNFVEMETILKLKSLSFSTREIKDFLHVIRMYNPNDDMRKQHLTLFFKDKKRALEEDRANIEKQISLLDKELSSLPCLTETDRGRQGFSISFMDYFYCPHCDLRLNMSKIEIQDGNLVNGELSCSCGYHASIEDGIVYVPNDDDLERIEETAKQISYDPSIIDDFMYFNDILEISPETSSMLAKAYSWLDSTVEDNIEGKKLLFMPGLSAHFLYKYIHQQYFNDIPIIVHSGSKEQLVYIKEHIEALSSHCNLMYIYGSVYNLPIKKNSIDFWIDAVASYEYSFFDDTRLHNIMAPYLSDTAEIIGITKFLDNSSKSIKNIQKLYPYAHKDNSKREPFFDTFKKLDWEIKEINEIGFVTDPGEYYIYMLPGDKHYFVGYWVTKK